MAGLKFDGMLNDVKLNANAFDNRLKEAKQQYGESVDLPQRAPEFDKSQPPIPGLYQGMPSSAMGGTQDGRAMSQEEFMAYQQQMAQMQQQGLPFDRDFAMGMDQINPNIPPNDNFPIEPVQQAVDANPFNDPRYNNVNLPDRAMEYQGGITENLINDKEVPEEIKKKWWWVFHKDNTLTFLDEARKMSKLLNFDIAKIDKLNTTPYYNYDFDMEYDFSVLRNIFETKLDRALGFKGGNTKNERIMIQSQFSENRQISEVGSSNNMIKEGFFKRLLGRR